MEQLIAYIIVAVVVAIIAVAIICAAIKKKMDAGMANMLEEQEAILKSVQALEKRVDALAAKKAVEGKMDKIISMLETQRMISDLFLTQDMLVETLPAAVEAVQPPVLRIYRDAFIWTDPNLPIDVDENRLVHLITQKMAEENAPMEELEKMLTIIGEMTDADFTSPNKRDVTPIDNLKAVLIKASEEDNDALLDHLVELGLLVDVNMSLNDNQDTMAILAAKKSLETKDNPEKVVDWLIKQDADFKKKNRQEESALSILGKDAEVNMVKRIEQAAKDKEAAEKTAAQVEEKKDTDTDDTTEKQE